MLITNLIIGIVSALLSLFSFIMAAKQGLQWSSQLNFSEKLKKSLITGIGFLVFFLSGVVALDHLVNPNIEKNWSLATLEGLLCFALPVGFLTIVGAFIWFSRREATQHTLSRRLNKIIEKSKNSRTE